MKKKWELEIQDWFRENVNKLPKNISNSDLVLRYYKDKHISDSTSVFKWLVGLSQKKYPTYTIVYRTLKQIKNKEKR